MYCCNPFMMYVSQITVLYTINLCSAVCQLYFNKIERKIEKEKKSQKNDTLNDLPKNKTVGKTDALTLNDQYLHLFLKTSFTFKFLTKW